MELRGELEPFEARYDSLVQSVQDRVDAVKQAIKDFDQLKRQRERGAHQTLESLWEGFEPPDETAQAKNTQDMPKDSRIRRQSKRLPASENLKQLYRKLARRYHPDLASDEDDRERRTNLMAMINEAYAQADIDALIALDNTSPQEEDKLENNDVPLVLLTLRQLQQTSADLAIQIQDLKAERHDLMYGALMDLKLTDLMARAEGRDILQEIATDLEKEYWALMKHLDVLRDSIR